MIIFYEILSVRKRKRMKNYHYDIIQQPGIKLAVRDREKKNDWILLNDIIIQ